MEEREFERMLEGLMSSDCSKGTEAFRDALLERCLTVLGEDTECVELDDEDLDMLAAAGDVYASSTTTWGDGQDIELV